MRRSLGCLMGLGWLAFGLAQIAAVAAALQYWLGWNSLVCALLAILFGWWPLVGTFIGMTGAHFAWGWSWLLSILLFWGVSIGLLMLLSFAGGLTIMFGKWSRRPFGRTIEVSPEDTQVMRAVNEDRDHGSPDR